VNTSKKIAVPAPIRVILAVIAFTCFLSATLMFTGCQSTTPQSAPTAFDSNVFNITTNVTVVTNQITQTNVTVVTQVVTNIVSGNPVIITNTIATTNFVPVTVMIPQTNYVYTPNANSTSITSGIGTTLSAFGVPGGSLIGTILAGGLALWGSLKSRQATTSGTIAGNATQIIQVARNIISALPNGAAVSSEFNAWLIQHQQDAGIANEVAAVVDQFVDPQDQALVGQAQTLINQAFSPLPVATGAVPNVASAVAAVAAVSPAAVPAASVTPAKPA
jgi:hypothetical protein